MKKISLTILIIMVLTVVSKAQYPAEVSGDTDYGIYFVKWPVGTESTGSTWGYLPDCSNFNTSFNFYYPSRDTSGNIATDFTIMKYEIYKQNYITGAFSLAFEQDEWGADPGAFVQGQTIIYSVMSANGESFDVEPFHRYYIRVTTKKGKVNAFNNIVPETFSIAHVGITQTVNFGACANDCDGYPLILGILNSSPANQAAGLYNPKYETDDYITSTTPLSSGEELILDAGEYIRLLPNFHADNGSEFRAYIDGCGGQRLGHFPDEDNNPDEFLLNIKSLSDINVYPNPTTGNFTVDLGGNNSEGIIQIMDLTGRIIYEQKLLNQLVSFDISKEKSGMYLAKIILNGEVVIKKIMKK